MREKNTLFHISLFRECRQLLGFIFFILQYFGDLCFAVLSRSEVSDCRVHVEMVRTECSVHKWQIDSLHTLLVTQAIRLSWHSFMLCFVPVIFVH